MIEELIGGTLGEFIGVTLVIFGGAGFMMGQALAQTWRPWWHLLPYSVLLAAANRFFSFALFEGELLSPGGFAADALAIAAIAGFAFRVTQVHIMVRQYPWLYERAGLFSWRSKSPS